MSLLSRLSAAQAGTDLAGTVRSILSTVDRAAPDRLAPPVPAPRRPSIPGPTGLGTAGLRIPPSTARPEPPPTARPGPPSTARPGSPVAVRPEPPSATRPGSPAAGVPELYCPPAVRDDPALGAAVNERLVEWAGEVGIYPGRLDRVRACDFGRLIMLAHPECDDEDRLLAAARCALAEWAVDDHYVDGEAGAATAPERLGQRLAIAYTAIDPAHLPERYRSELDEVRRRDPVMVALRDSLDNLARYATAAQVARLRHELSVMFVAYDQEAVWRATGAVPPVWEYLMHRHENSFLPCMVLIDPVGGYELPPAEFADPRVRRVFSLAGTASVLVNDLYSMAKEDPTDTNLPRVIAAEERCSLAEAVDRSVAVHDELMHTFESEAAALCLTGSPMLQRFLAGIWAWLGGSREWHAGSARYRPAAQDTPSHEE